MSRGIAAAALLLGAVVLTSAEAGAHGGGLDRYGCHNDRRNGGYHCHRGSGPSPDRSNRRELRPRSLLTTPANNSDLVRAAQTLLNHLDCDAGAVDGGVGPQTRAAIDRFNLATQNVHSTTAVDATLVFRLSDAVATNRRCQN